MQLEIYAGKYKAVTLVQHYLKDKDTDKLMINTGKFAVPGRKVADEKQVRTWAGEWGYSVKKKYDTFDLVEE
jgi:glutathione synthase/RimK-type ligase-like ATP-grasp enzyme